MSSLLVLSLFIQNLGSVTLLPVCASQQSPRDSLCGRYDDRGEKGNCVKSCHCNKLCTDGRTCSTQIYDMLLEYGNPFLTVLYVAFKWWPRASFRLERGLSSWARLTVTHCCVAVLQCSHAWLTKCWFHTFSGLSVNRSCFETPERSLIRI